MATRRPKLQIRPNVALRGNSCASSQVSTGGKSDKPIKLEQAFPVKSPKPVESGGNEKQDGLTPGLSGRRLRSLSGQRKDGETPAIDTDKNISSNSYAVTSPVTSRRGAPGTRIQEHSPNKAGAEVTGSSEKPQLTKKNTPTREVTQQESASANASKTGACDVEEEGRDDAKVNRRSRIKPQVQIRGRRPATVSTTAASQPTVNVKPMSREAEGESGSVEQTSVSEESNSSQTQGIEKHADSVSVHVGRKKSDVIESQTVQDELPVNSVSSSVDVAPSKDVLDGQASSPLHDHGHPGQTEVLPSGESTDKATEEGEQTKPAFRRSRFAKARPNLADAGRSRIRHASQSLGESCTPTTKDHPSTSSSALEVVSVVTNEEPLLEMTCNGTTEEVVTTSNDTSAAPTGGSTVKGAEKKRRSQKTRRTEQMEKAPDTSKLTIRDLIYLNPVNNPMKSSVEEKEKRKQKLIEERRKSKARTESLTSVTETAPEVVAGTDDALTTATEGDAIVISSETAEGTTPEAAGAGQESRKEPGDGAMEKNSGGTEAAEVNDGEDEEDGMPVPQVKIGPDGSIILNEASLVIKQAGENKTAESEVVVENGCFNPSLYYRKRKRSKLWTTKETTKFYVALSMVGTDFSMMDTLFSHRIRSELKRKFKVEERRHRQLIEKALKERKDLDMAFFASSEDELEGQENRENQKVAKAKPKTKRVRKAKQANTNVQKPGDQSVDGDEGPEGGQEVDKTPAQQAQKRKANSDHPDTGNEVKKKKNKSKRGRSRYYDSSSESEEERPRAVADEGHAGGDAQPPVSQAENGIEHISGGESSSSETETMQNLTKRSTRSGRQPKATKMFASEVFDTAYSRQPRTKITEGYSKPQPVFILKGVGQGQGPGGQTPARSEGPAGVASMLSPSVQLPGQGQFLPLSSVGAAAAAASPIAPTKQQLVFVTSTPPSNVDKDAPQLIHVYLMSPPGTPNPLASPPGATHPLRNLERDCLSPRAREMKTALVSTPQSRPPGTTLPVRVPPSAPPELLPSSGEIPMDTSAIHERDSVATTSMLGGGRHTQDMEFTDANQENGVLVKVESPAVDHSVHSLLTRTSSSQSGYASSEVSHITATIENAAVPNAHPGDGLGFVKAADQSMDENVQIIGSYLPPTSSASNTVFENATITTINNDDGTFDLLIDPKFNSGSEEEKPGGREFKVIDIALSHPIKNELEIAKS